jgi:methylated-DNA-[protein]-cysteine S-methyltransferase
MTVTFYREISSPIGPITIAGHDDVLTNLAMHDQTHPPAGVADWKRDNSAFGEVADQLDSYFAGDLTDFDVQVSLTGTEFQVSVWQGLREIPYGETRSYGQLARSIGNPGAARAVGLANGRNPVAIIVPCHRVIGSGGALVGFGGGLERKQALLDIESDRRAPRLLT